MKIFDASNASHTEYFVEVAGVKNPDGTPGRISMDAETFAECGFAIGQTISLREAAKLALKSVGGAPEQLSQAIDMAVRLGPGKKVGIK